LSGELEVQVFVGGGWSSRKYFLGSDRRSAVEAANALSRTHGRDAVRVVFKGVDPKTGRFVVQPLEEGVGAGGDTLLAERPAKVKHAAAASAAPAPPRGTGRPKPSLAETVASSTKMAFFERLLIEEVPSTPQTAASVAGSGAAQPRATQRSRVIPTLCFLGAALYPFPTSDFVLLKPETDDGQVVRESCLEWKRGTIGPSDACKALLHPLKAARHRAAAVRTTTAPHEAKDLPARPATTPLEQNDGTCRNEGKAVICKIKRTGAEPLKTAAMPPPEPGAVEPGLSGNRAAFAPVPPPEQADLRRAATAVPSGERVCSAIRPRDTVIVLDASTSMGLPVDMPIALEAELDHRMDAGDKTATAEYRKWLNRPGMTRMDRAQQAMRDYLTRSESARLGAVTFQGCSDTDIVVVPPSTDRSGVEGLIERVEARRNVKTALDASLRAAARLLGGQGGHILLLTDGRETCGGDPCRAAAEIAATAPGVQIDVISVGGHAIPACIAQLTGGRTDAVATKDAEAITVSMAAAAESYCR